MKSIIKGKHHIALVDFHEGMADSASVLMHQVLAADNLGDDLFLNYICRKLDVPFGRINGSNTSYEVKMALRDSFMHCYTPVRMCIVEECNFLNQFSCTLN